jgi:predicted PurR-regulated permease PerM
MTKLNKHNKTGTIVLLIFFGIIMFITMKAYLNLFFLALIVAMVTFPVYNWFLKKTKSKTWASIITSFLFLLAVIIPFGLFFIYTLDQAITFFNSLQNSEEIAMFIENLKHSLPILQDWLISIDIEQLIIQVASMISGFLKAIVVPGITGIIMFFVNLTFFMLILIYLYPDRKKFFNVVTEIIPLDTDLSHKFISRFTVVTQKMVVSVFLAALAQGLLGGLIFWILGIPAAGFWTVVMTVAAFLPLGSGLIWVPAGLLMILTGNIVDGIIILLWGMIVISSADNVLRGSMLKGGKTQIPEIITLISALGGIVVFGFFGFIYGPIIAAGFLTALDIYREYQRKENEENNAVDNKENNKIKDTTQKSVSNL